ncbi:TPA: fimbrial protein [Citrobacter koseri]|uniref:fimbrial protein n=1 Tax=Citrobacter koseri TaxID=545 RepID=UPI00388FB80B|nr:fimbrial protein [Citrobacter koseri]
MPVRKQNHMMSRYPVRRIVLSSALVLSGLLWGIQARAAGCTGWGTDTSREVTITQGDIILSAGSTLTASPGGWLGAGSAAVPSLVCTDDSGQTITGTTWTWLGGSDIGDVSRRGGDTTGIALDLMYTRAGGIQGNFGSGTLNTQGFDWQSVRLGLIYRNGSVDISQPALRAGPLIRGTLTLPDGATRTLTIVNGSTIRVVPECVVDAIPSVEFGNVSMLRFTSVGDTGPQKPFTVDVTCPANIQTGGMTLSLSSPQTDAADPTLLGNSGTATGIGVEVLDGNGNRVNANGSVAGAGFVTSTSQTWGVRFVRTGTVSAGTVRATATINVTVQ